MFEARGYAAFLQNAGFFCRVIEWAAREGVVW